jgi:transcriptional regulator with XRE-family HTH domain
MLSRGMSQSMLVGEMRDKFHWYKYQQQVNQWATGFRLPDIESLYYMSKVLQVSCETLIEIFLEIKYAK